MGYSLGGRLALHSLIDAPHLWKGAIIISAHPGLLHKEERLLRYQRDLAWGECFENEEWSSLQTAWNGQEVFGEDQFFFERREIDYQRSKLSEALVNGSLGLQEELSSSIAALPFPILWITGERDIRFCEAAKRLTFAHSHSMWRIVPGAGHRVPWSCPEQFIAIVEEFLVF